MENERKLGKGEEIKIKSEILSHKQGLFNRMQLHACMHACKQASTHLVAFTHEQETGF